MPMAAAAMTTPNNTLNRMDWHRTVRLSPSRPAPRYWAIWTEKPTAMALVRPFISQMELATTPMAAVAPGPRLPTMAVSI